MVLIFNKFGIKNFLLNRIMTKNTRKNKHKKKENYETADPKSKNGRKKQTKKNINTTECHRKTKQKHFQQKQTHVCQNG